jgi:RimJ/RimL family protein N-acetyltransferase
MKLQLIPIKKTIDENEEFFGNPDCHDTLQLTIDFFTIFGYAPPWIGYYVTDGNQIVGSAGFKGKPIDNEIEIAYGTFERFRQKGIGTGSCKLLVDLALQTDPSVKITARTLSLKNYSARILEKNGFDQVGPIMDPEDGEIWEWVFKCLHR